MLFAVIFIDKPGCGDIRSAQLSAHIAWLEAHQDIIPVGGSTALGSIGYAECVRELAEQAKEA